MSGTVVSLAVAVFFCQHATCLPMFQTSFGVVYQPSRWIVWLNFAKSIFRDQDDAVVRSENDGDWSLNVRGDNMRDPSPLLLML